MATWKIELRNARRDRTAGTIMVDAENLVKAKRHTIRVCRRHLRAGRDLSLAARGNRTYGILLGRVEVGEATITRLEPRRQSSRKTEDQEKNRRLRPDDTGKETTP